jgi:ribokinase
MKAKICVVGSINYDLVAKGERIPRPGETLIGSEFITAPGGKGANQAVASARLGSQVSMVGRVGDDAFGSQLIENMSSNRVDTRLVWRTAGTATGVALIMVDQTGQNSILVAPGANMALTPADITSAREAITSVDILLLQLEIPVKVVIEAARLAHQSGVKVVLNPAPARPLPVELLQWVDYLIPNQYEAQIIADGQPSLSRNLVSRLLDTGIKNIIITLGGEGAELINENGIKYFQAFKVTPLDTTAAGDAFVGSFAVALAEGQPQDVAIRWGNAAGALATTRMGAQPSLPNREEVEKLLHRI